MILKSHKHEVRLTQGFWLFDTPRTQAWWQTVMGTNPSGFPSEQRQPASDRQDTSRTASSVFTQLEEENYAA